MNKEKQIFLVHVDHKIGAVCENGNGFISYASSSKFVDFVKGLKEDYPDFMLHCVNDERLKEKVRQRVKQDLEINKIYMKEKLARRKQND